MLRTPIPEWEADFDGIYSGKLISVEPVDFYNTSELEDELRVIRGTKSMFIGDYEKILEMLTDISVYHSFCSRATIKINNPDYLDFDVYTKNILNDPLKSIYEVKSVSADLAKKYMEYAVLYDKDKKYSDKLLVKPYFATTDAGILILTEDFVDFNLNLKVDPENGVVGFTVSMSENTSHYIKNYREI